MAGYCAAAGGLLRSKEVRYKSLGIWSEANIGTALDTNTNKRESAKPNLWSEEVTVILPWFVLTRRCLTQAIPLPKLPSAKELTLDTSAEVDRPLLKSVAPCRCRVTSLKEDKALNKLKKRILKRTAFCCTEDQTDDILGPLTRHLYLHSI